MEKTSARTVHQDNARKNVLDMLEESDIYLVADWAMKWLPTWYREPQREFFGKRGLPWHFTYAIRIKPSTDSASSSSSSSSVGTDTRVFEHRTFCHVFDNVKQDGRTVVSILSDVRIQLFDVEYSMLEIRYLQDKQQLGLSTYDNTAAFVHSLFTIRQI